MVQSMTGFGRCVLSEKDKTLSVEIKSVNSKQSDISVRMPGKFRAKESDIKSLINEHLERGKIDVFIHLESTSVSEKLLINKELALEYYKELKSLGEFLNEKDQNLLPHVLKMPDVIKTSSDEATEDEFLMLMKVLRGAITELVKFRKQEGLTLEKDLGNRIGYIKESLKKVEDYETERVDRVKSRLMEQLQKLQTDEKIDKNRFEQELIYYLEKFDITEEKVRLLTHCDYFIKTMHEESSTGRKLNFITQEIGREINTIGSKANHAEIQKLVVLMKDELEKIKEQGLNML